MIDAVRIRRNTVFSFAAALIRMLATMLMFVGIARFFGPEAFGQFALAHTYLTIFYIIADFGIDILFMAELPHRREETGQFIRRFFSLKTILSLLALCGMCGVAFLSGMSEATRILMFVMSAAIIGNSATVFVLGILKGHEQFSFEAHTSFWQHLVLLVGLLILGFLEADIVAVAGFFVFSRFIGFFYVLPRALKYLKQTPIQWSVREWLPALRDVAPFGFHILLGTLYFQLDTILISVYQGDYRVGIYQSAMKLVMLSLVVSDVASGAFMPTLARLLRENEERAVKAARLFAKVLLYVGMPVALMFFMFPHEILVIVYGGEEFAGAGLVLKILALTVFLRFATDAYAMFLTASGRQTRRAVISAVSSGVSFVLNILLIPRYGIEAAAAVSVAVHLLAGGLAIVLQDPRNRSVLVQPDMRRGVVVLVLVIVTAVLVAAETTSVVLGAGLILTSATVSAWFFGMTAEERTAVLRMAGT
ncbi:MAG: flippase [Bacteroidota bacterium]